MKCYVLMISEYFPKGHIKEGEPTGFPLAIKHYDKIHTIRGNYDLWEKRFEEIHAGRAYLSIRVWSGKPYQSKQHEIFRFDETHGIGLEKLQMRFYPNAWVYGSIVPFEVLCKNDGLTLKDFDSFFKKKLSYKGITEEPMAIIHFTNFRYACQI